MKQQFEFNFKLVVLKQSLKKQSDVEGNESD